MKKYYLFVIENFEDKNFIEYMEVQDYTCCGKYYDLKFKDGYGSISKARVLKIIKLKLRGVEQND